MEKGDPAVAVIGSAGGTLEVTGVSAAHGGARIGHLTPHSAIPAPGEAWLGGGAHGAASLPGPAWSTNGGVGGSSAPYGAEIPGRAKAHAALGAPVFGVTSSLPSDGHPRSLTQERLRTHTCASGENSTRLGYVNWTCKHRSFVSCTSAAGTDSTSIHRA